MKIKRWPVILLVLVFAFGSILPLLADGGADANDAQSGVAGEAKWPSLGGNFGRSGQSRNIGPLAGRVRWKFETGGAVVGSVTVGSEGRIHVACEDGKLYTLNSEGEPLWVHDVNTPLLSAPTIGSDGVLYVGGRDGRLFSIGPDGQLRWAHRTDGAIYSSPAVGSNGQVCAGSTDGVLRALNAGTGEEVWRFETKGPGALPNGAIFASPSIGPDGTVYIAGLYDPNLYALNPADGSVKWACRFPANSDDPNTGGWPFAAPVVAEGGAIYQTLLYDRRLYAIEPATGAILWSAEFPDSGIPVTPNLSIPANGDGWSEPVLGPDGTIYVSFDDLYIHAVDPTGEVKWSKAFGQVGAFTMVVDKAGTVYAASDDGFLYVVASDGTELARFETGGWPVYPVIAADNLLILADSRDYCSLEKDAKNTVWAIETGDME